MVILNILRILTALQECGVVNYFIAIMNFKKKTNIFLLAVLEYVGPKWRTFVANMSIAIFFTMASTALPWIAYYLADWKMFAIVTSAPLGLAILTPWIVPESARFDFT